MSIRDRFYQKLQESREQLDELSDPTHMSYRAKARNQLDKMTNRLGSKMGSDTVDTKKMKNRADGIKRSYKLQPKKKLEEEQLDELRGLTPDTKKKLQKRIRDKHDKAWDETERIRKEKKSKGSEDTKKIDAFRNRLGKIHNKLDK